MKVKLVRNTRSGQIYIEVIFPNGHKSNLWEDIVEHCARDFTNKELAKIYDECNKQLLNTDPDDIPLSFHEVMKELQQTIINRKTWKLDLIANSIQKRGDKND